MEELIHGGRELLVLLVDVIPLALTRLSLYNRLALSLKYSYQPVSHARELRDYFLGCYLIEGRDKDL